ncbi:MAG: four helix bundle protein [Planctomycetes bacterium]|nr:four helix bundle protein [Planctomycetota bacterium]
MASIERFKDIKAWQRARKLTREIYAATKVEHFARDYGLRDQITRASGSIMHNIAEGFDAESNGDFIRFLGYAKRSCTEVQSQLYVAADQDYIDNETFSRLYTLADETRATIRGFLTYLRNNPR